MKEDKDFCHSKENEATSIILVVPDAAAPIHLCEKVLVVVYLNKHSRLPYYLLSKD